MGSKASKKTSGSLILHYLGFLFAFILASVSLRPPLIIESVARVSHHVLFTHELLVKQV